MITIDATWAAAERRTSRARRPLLAPLRQFLRMIDNPHARMLSGRLTLTVPDESSARALESWIIGEHRAGRLTRQETAGWLGLTYAALRELNARGAKLALTRLAEVLAPTPSPFSPDAMAAAERVDQWRDALHGWIRSQRPTDSGSWIAGVLISAVVHGSLVDAVKLQNICERLQRGVRPDVSDPFVTMSFDLPFEGLGNHHLQRWVLDPVTEMLVWRLPTTPPGNFSVTLLQGICTLLTENGVTDERCPASVHDLVHSAATWWSARAARIDIEAATRHFTTHAFAPRTWARIQGLVLESAPARIMASGVEPTLIDEALTDLSLLHPWLEAAFEILEGDNLEVAHASCSELLWAESEYPLAQTYLGWLKATLEGHSATHAALEMSTIRRRFFVTAPRLLAVLGDENPTKMTTPKLEDIYSELTSDPDPALPIKDLASGLLDFHAWLAKDWRKPRIRKESEVLGYDLSLRPVDADLPTVDDYLAALAWLDRQLRNGWSDDDIALCKIVLMIAFRAGARRMEIFGLRLEDIHVRGGLFALIRKHDGRRLKTKNSRRMLPLQALLTASERQLLLAWIRRRQKEAKIDWQNAGRTQYLFPQFDRPGAKSWIQRTCHRVCLAIREVTGDLRLHLHHLRHAFASWTYLALRAPDYPSVCHHFRTTPATAAMLRGGRRLRLRLIYRDETPDRSWAFVVGRLLGHSSPAISLAHYVHAADLFLGATAWRETKEIPVPVLVAASGLSLSAAYENLAEGSDAGIFALTQATRNKFGAPLATQPTTKPAQRGRPPMPAVHGPDWISFETLLALLTLAINAGKDDEYIAHDLGLDVMSVSAILKSSANWGSCINLAVQGGRLTEAPPRPRGESERMYFRDLELKLADMATRAPAALDDGLAIHLTQFNSAKHDVVFRGRKDLPKLRRYLVFLGSLGVSADDFRWVVRRPKSAAAVLPSWCSELVSRWQPASVKRIAPASTAKAESYAEWIGILPVDAKGFSAARILAVAALLGSISRSTTQGKTP